MTDAALSVTQSSVEQFTRRYFESLGCSIEDQGKRWTVEIPEEANTEIGDGELSLVCSADESEAGEDEQTLHPESALFQTVVEEAAGRAPVGATSVTDDDVELRLPGWATESDLEIVDAEFTPYYNRTAVVALVRVSIETVSEYQTELLRAISFDARSKEKLPGLMREFLDLTTADRERLDESTVELSRGELGRHLKHASREVEEAVRPKIDEIHENASRAADVELEEYRRLQQQRINELKKDIDSLDDRIDELSQRVQQSVEQVDRKEDLRERKRLRGEREELREQLREVRERREAGFPDKQREIRDRHKLEVSVEPVAVTTVEYETGDLTLSFADDGSRQTITVGYGSGAGVTESVTCDRCERTLTSKNPLYLAGERTICRECEFQEEKAPT